MITNLISTVLVSVVTTTNDIPRWTPQECLDGQASWIMYVDEALEGVKLIDDTTGKTNIVRFPTGSGIATTKKPEDERVRIITVKRVTQLEFIWLGFPRKIIEEDILSEKRTIFKKKETWEEVK